MPAGVRISATAPRLPFFAGARRPFSHEIGLTWTTPTRSARLAFRTRDIAFAVAFKYRRGQYKLGDEVVHAGSLDTTVILHRVPVGTTEDIVRSSIIAHEQPIRIGFKNSSSGDEYTDEEVCAFIPTLLGSIENLELAIAETDGELQAFACVFKSIDARQAMESLNDKHVQSRFGMTITARLFVRSEFEVLTEVYECMSSRIRSFEMEWRKRGLIVRRFVLDTDFTALRLSASQNKVLAEASAAFETLINGRAIENDDHEFLWHPCLRTELYMPPKLTEYRGKHSGVLIAHNVLQERIIYYGPPELYERVRQQFSARLAAKYRSRKVIDLKESGCRWLCHPGWALMESVIGKGVLFYDPCSYPRKFYVNGSTEQYQHALAILQSHNASLQNNTTPCPICFGPAEDPINLTCDHSYCRACFQQFCASIASSIHPNIPIRCLGDDDHCHQMLTISELSGNLSRRTFEDLLRASFRSYIAHRPKQYKWCPTPGCDTIYRAAKDDDSDTDTDADTDADTETDIDAYADGDYPDDNENLRCWKCFEEICMKCHRSQHNPMTCEEYEEAEPYYDGTLDQGELDLAWCDRCTSMIQRLDGCLHLTCHCGAHICWACEKVFDTASQTYEHLAICPWAEEVVANEGRLEDVEGVVDQN